ncbi:hypothetical protein tb265_49080 [Gemmatimonadetes bacterium T265]|nr:hypothetical protein tb265_49080 [Gemmatimonadetes bacterium T265]
MPELANGAATYQYLRLDGGWPSFVLSGVAADDAGALTLAPLPRLADPLTDPLPPVPGLDGPAGVGVAPCGDVYVADAAGHRVLRVPACGGPAEPFGCLGGPGSEPGLLDAPRGVLVGPRDALYVADSGNARVLVVDLATAQVRDVWGVPRGDPAPSDAPGGFVQPWDLAADRAGYVYVADPGAQDADGRWSGGRVQKFRPDGAVVPAFADAVAASPEPPGAPASVAVTLLDPADPASERLVVLDRQPPRLLVYTTDGAPDAAATARWAQALGDDATSVAAGGGVLYVAEPAAGRVLVFGADGAFRGTAPDAGAASGLALDCHGRLLLNPGGAGGAVRRALGAPAYAECGTFLAGPFEAPDAPNRWQRVVLDADALPDGAHLRLFTLTSDALDGVGANRPAPPATCGAAPDPGVVADDDPGVAPPDRWRAAPQDALDLRAANAPGRYFWIAGVLQGDGTATPVVRQIRVTHDEDGWIRFLPALYQRDDGGRLFLERLLGAFEDVLDESDAELDALPRYVDPAAAPDAAPRPSWLEWLAGWVDVELGESWPDARRRATVAAAFGAHARRGTRERLRELVALYAGATPLIEELGAAGVWVLGTRAALGVDTALAEGSPQGAVLASTAVVDGSVLTDGREFGAAAFAGAAHRFAVHVYEAELPAADGVDAGLARVRRVLDREKPAHTTYHLCAIGPRMRVGLQARVGVDAVVAGPPAPAPLGTAAERGAALALGGDPPGARPSAAVGDRVGAGAAVV